MYLRSHRSCVTLPLSAQKSGKISFMDEPKLPFVKTVAEPNLNLNFQKCNIWTAILYENSKCPIYLNVLACLHSQVSFIFLMFSWDRDLSYSTDCSAVPTQYLLNNSNYRDGTECNLHLLRKMQRCTCILLRNSKSLTVHFKVHIYFMELKIHTVKQTFTIILLSIYKNRLTQTLLVGKVQQPKSDHFQKLYLLLCIDALCIWFIPCKK